METVGIDQIEPSPVPDESTCRRLTDSVDTTELALNHYRIAPGDGLPGGLHAHMDQEEVFFIIEGTATFETLNGLVEVTASEAIRFARGEFHSGKNTAESDLVVLAIGCPRETEDIRIPVSCLDCSNDTLQLDLSGDQLTFRCQNCAAEHIPQDCLSCGHHDLRVTRGQGGRTITVCQNCGAEYQAPPIHD